MIEAWLRRIRDDRVRLARAAARTRRRWRRNRRRTGSRRPCRGAWRSPASSSRCRVCVPQMKRTEAMPKPNASSARPRRRDDVGMIGEAEIIVGAEIDHLARPAADATRMRPPCGPVDQPLALGQAAGFDLVERRAEVFEKGVGHGASRFVPSSSIAAPREGSNRRAIVPRPACGERLEIISPWTLAPHPALRAAFPCARRKDKGAVKSKWRGAANEPQKRLAPLHQWRHA